MNGKQAAAIGFGFGWVLSVAGYILLTHGGNTMVTGFNYLTTTDLIRMTEVVKLLIVAFTAGMLLGCTVLAWVVDKFTVEIGREV